MTSTTAIIRKFDNRIMWRGSESAMIERMAMLCAGEFIIIPCPSPSQIRVTATANYLI